MVPEYIKYIQGLMGRNDIIKTSDLIARLETNIENVENIKPFIGELINIDIKQLNSKRVKHTVYICNSASVSGKDIKSCMKSILTRCDCLIEGCGMLVDLIDDDNTKFYMLDTLTAKQSAIILYGQRLINASEILQQLLVFTTYVLQQDNFIYKKKSDDLTKALSAYSITMANMNRKEIKKKIKAIDGLSNDPGDNGNLSISDSMFSIPGRNNFTGNPIYHIRRWWQDREFDSYKKNQADVKLLELKLAELQAIASGNNVPLNIQTQIEYYEDEIKKYERKIEEFRNE